MNTWLVNSNSNTANKNPNGFKYMLRQNKIAAYYDRKEQTDKIIAGDLVLLYHNNNRVIAVGFVVGEGGHDYGEQNDIESWKDVNWIWQTTFDSSSTPVNFINRHDLGAITKFRRTVEKITDQIDYQALFAQIGQQQSYLLGQQAPVKSA